MHGFYQLVLKIDLSRQTYEELEVSAELLARTLGGKGLASHLLLEHNPPGVDPLSPENHLIFATGPVAASQVWGSCRYGVYTKSPQTGFYSESYSGGKAAEFMAASGYDAIMIHGAAKEPLWLEISDQAVRFHPAGELWGLETYQSEDRVKAWCRENRPGAGGWGVVCIGPAGENQVSFAVIENDYWRSAGRTGVGAVMGSKKIKAIAFGGQAKKTYADPQRLLSFSKQMAALSKDNPVVKSFKTMGTPMLVDIINNAGAFPTRYWQKGRYERAHKINADALHQRCQVTPHSCLKCFMACGRLTTVTQGRHQGLKVEGPEYETIYAFGGLCELDSIEEIIYLNDICDRLGMDTITAGNLAAFTIEASRQGKIDYQIDYGQAEAIAGLLEDMARCRGLGEVLSRGIKHAARAWGMEDQAIHVKGLEPAGYDPRVLKGMGLAYGSSDRGACHLRSSFYKPEIAGVSDPDQIEGKADIFTEWEDRLTVFDTLILCRFYRDLYQWDELAEIIACVTGLEMSKQKMRALASYVSDCTRRFNLREGLRPEDDQLPRRFYRQALPESGKVITQEQMNRLLSDYYRARGWNQKGEPKDDAR